MKRIKLTQGRYTVVDDEDYEELNMSKWFYNSGYAGRHIRKEKLYTVFIHSLLMNPPEGYLVDHINGDTLDNRRTNLRFCTKSENAHNRKASIGGTSKYKGVTWRKDWGKWVAQIKVAGKKLSLGGYSKEEEAALAYNEAALKYFGEFSKLNNLVKE